MELERHCESPTLQRLKCRTEEKLPAYARQRRRVGSSLVESNAVDEILKPRIIANGIKVGMHLKELQNV